MDDTFPKGTYSDAAQLSVPIDTTGKIDFSVSAQQSLFYYFWWGRGCEAIAEIFERIVNPYFYLYPHACAIFCASALSNYLSLFAVDPF